MEKLLPAHEALYQFFKDWKDKAPTARSLNLLSKRTGIPLSTLHRIFEGGSELGINRIISILEEVATPLIRISYLRSYYPEFADFVEKTYQIEEVARLRGGHEISGEESFSSYFTQLKYFQILSMLFIDDDVGVPAEKIEKEFGQTGLNHLENLVQNGMVFKNKAGRFVAKQYSTAKKEILLELVKNTCLRLEQGSKKYKVMSHFNSLSQEGIDVLKEILLSCEDRVVKTMNNPQYFGNLPVNFSAILGVLESATVSEENRGQP